MNWTKPYYTRPYYTKPYYEITKLMPYVNIDIFKSYPLEKDPDIINIKTELDKNLYLEMKGFVQYYNYYKSYFQKRHKKYISDKLFLELKSYIKERNLIRKMNKMVHSELLQNNKKIKVLKMKYAYKCSEYEFMESKYKKKNQELIKKYVLYPHLLL